MRYRGLSDRLVSVERDNDSLTLTTENGAYLLTRWPELTILRRTRHGAWEPVPRHIERFIIECLDSLRICSVPQWRLACYSLLEALPLHVHVRLVPLQSQYWCGAQFLAKAPRGCDLLASTPALFAAAVARSRCSTVDAHPLALIAGGDVEIAERLGFHGSHETVQALRKFGAYDLSVDEWRLVAKRLRLRPVLDAVLSHTHVPPHTVLSLAVDDPAGVLSPSVFAALLDDAMGRSMSQPRFEDVRFAATIAAKFGEQRTAFKTLPELFGWFGEIDQRLKNAHLCGSPDLSAASFERLSTVGELREESALLRNGIATWEHVSEALAGHRCYYRVASPTRATACFWRDAAWSEWQLQEVRGCKGAVVFDAFEPVSAAMRAAA